MDVRDSIFDIKKNVKSHGSLILLLIEFIGWLLQFISITAWYGQIRRWCGVKTPFPQIITELWLILILLIQIVILANWRITSETSNLIFFWLPVWFLIDSISATLRDVILAPNIHGGFVQVYNRQRWLVLTLISSIEMILSFAILVLYHRTQFNLPIPDSLTAVYISAVTFLTLGYGDFYPTEYDSKVLVLGELGFFLLFLALKLPMAVGMIQVNDFKENDKN